MTAKELFSVAVRLIGFWVLVQGALYILFRIPYIGIAMPEVFVLNQLLVTWASGIVQILVGGWILFKADAIVRLVYGASTKA
jgi:hypothetical protein